jgi:hypothetical protein
MGGSRSEILRKQAKFNRKASSFKLWKLVHSFTLTWVRYLHKSSMVRLERCNAISRPTCMQFQTSRLTFSFEHIYWHVCPSIKANWKYLRFATRTLRSCWVANICMPHSLSADSRRRKINLYFRKMITQTEKTIELVDPDSKQTAKASVSSLEAMLVQCRGEKDKQWLNETRDRAQRSRPVWTMDFSPRLIFPK